MWAAESEMSCLARNTLTIENGWLEFSHDVY